MVEVFDFLEDEDGDMLVLNGDLVIGESTLKHQKDMIEGDLNSYPNAPLSCVGLRTFLLDNPTYDDVKAIIQEKFQKDGQVIRSIKLPTIEDLTVEAGYE